MRKYVVIRMVDGHVTDVSDTFDWPNLEDIYLQAYDNSLELMHDHDVRIICSLVYERFG